MKKFIDPEFKMLLELNKLADFSALWNVELREVDKPNQDRGGWSTVAYLELQNQDQHVQGFYIKRQQRHLIRTWRHPFGEPTCAREMFNIQLCGKLRIPALEAVYFEYCKKNQQAILVTRRLDGFEPLSDVVVRWQSLDTEYQNKLIDKVAALVGLLHRHNLSHNCLYPKHIFIHNDMSEIQARLIDLEKMRYRLFSRTSRINDIAALLRRLSPWSMANRSQFLLVYLVHCGLRMSPGQLASAIDYRAADKVSRQ